jgi:formylglycine-generating enzyme required for sulfatase activity
MVPRCNWFIHLLCVCLLGLLAFAGRAAPSASNMTMSAGNEHRVALVVGNADYKASPLKNPVNDARAMTAKLKSLGFQVVHFENLKTRQVGSALREFRNLIRPGSVALFFYAGHGLQVRGENYLPTVDAELASEEDVPNQSLNLAAVLNLMEDSKASVNLVLLDACRNNPYARSFRSESRGLARVQAPGGTLIHYATRPGSVAEDGGGSHGTYTEALLAQIDEQGVPIETALKRVTIRVREVTKGKQEPWMEGSLTGDFYFTVTGNAQITVQPAPANADAAAWQAAESSNSAAAFQAYLGEFPSGMYAPAARIKLASLKPAAALAPVPVAPAAPVAAPLLTPVPAGTRDPEAFVWRDAQARGGREHFEAYLQQYPKGRNAAAARAAIKSLSAPEVDPKVRNEQQVWDGTRKTNSEQAYKSYLLEFPSGRFVAEANSALASLRPAVTNVAVAAGLANDPRRQERTVDVEKEKARAAAVREFGVARLAAARFVMGADPTEPGDNGPPDEAAQPQHEVAVTGFEMTYYEVSVGQFRKFVEATAYVTEAEGSSQPGCMVPGAGGQWSLQKAANWRAPGYSQTDAHAVVCLSWNDVQAYVHWLNGGTGFFRLPSEAEWEYAARAGTTTPRPWADGAGFWSRTWTKLKPGVSEPASRACKYANVADQRLRGQVEWNDAFNCDDGYAYTVPPAYFGRNNFGLYDMLGNVAEWTQDCWNPNHEGAPAEAQVRNKGDCSRRVVRGGSWASPQSTIRSAARLSQPTSYRASDLGFRLARTQKD